MLGRALGCESEGMGLSLALPRILGFVSLGQITLPPGFILFLCRVRQILAFKVVKRLWRIWDVKLLAECQGFLVGLSLSIHRRLFPGPPWIPKSTGAQVPHRKWHRIRI